VARLGAICAATLLAGMVALAVGAAPAGDVYPPRSDVRAASGWLKDRRGDASLALLDSGGSIHGVDARRPYAAASVVKAMLLVAYLRQLDGRGPSREERSLLGPMITRSSNKAATAVHRRLGSEPLHELARRVGMRNFSLPRPSWASAQVTAADLARLFARIDRLVPRRNRRYARELLAGIVPRHRWGFSRAARRAGFRILFKGGWRRTPRGRLVHEAALLQRGRMRLALVMLTDGSPSHRYGTATLRGVAERLLRPVGSAATRSAGLDDLHRLAPSLRLDLRYATRRNFTGRRLPGYCRPWALMRRTAARDLARVQRDLRRRGLGLLVFDAYRPARASRAMVRWAQGTGRSHLVGTYIAERSRHNLGTAVDLTLIRRGSGRPLPMGTRYDSFSRRAHTRAVRGRPRRNRRVLVRAMARRGFVNYHREWWHFEHRLPDPRYLDLPLGCEN
jgi:zinc D-Ala-D-Ala dipeptidase